MADEKKETKKETRKISKEVESIINSVEKLSVLHLAELVDALEQEFGVSAAPVATTIATSPAAGEGTPAEEKTEFDVILTSFGDKKIQVIKAVRTIKPDLGLADAKKLVEGIPATILGKAKKEDAEEAKKKLEDAGGSVELK